MLYPAELRVRKPLKIKGFPILGGGNVAKPVKKTRPKTRGFGKSGQIKRFPSVFALVLHEAAEANRAERTV